MTEAIIRIVSDDETILNEAGETLQEGLEIGQA